MAPARGKIGISARILPEGSDGTVLMEECGVRQKHKRNDVARAIASTLQRQWTSASIFFSRMNVIYVPDIKM